MGMCSAEQLCLLTTFLCSLDLYDFGLWPVVLRSRAALKCCPGMPKGTPRSTPLTTHIPFIKGGTFTPLIKGVEAMKAFWQSPHQSFWFPGLLHPCSQQCFCATVRIFFLDARFGRQIAGDNVTCELNNRGEVQK